MSLNYIFLDVSLVMKNRKHNRYAGLGLLTQYMVEQSSVLDTRAAPVTNSEVIPSAPWDHIRCFLGVDIADANSTILNNVRCLPFVVRLRTCVVQLKFVLRDKLAAPVIFGCKSCDRFIEEICSSAKRPRTANDSTVHIIREPLKHAM